MENRDHAGAYKNRGIRGTEQARRRRQDNALQLRKEKREDNFAKRRNLQVNESFEDDNGNTPVKNEVLNDLTNTNRTNTPSKQLAPLPEIVNGIMAGMQMLQTSNVTPTGLSSLKHYVQQCRKMLSRERKPPIDSIIDAGLVPHLSALLTLDCLDFIPKDPETTGLVFEILFEAAWALTNICSGSPKQTKTVSDAGAIPQFVRLLTLEKYINVVEQAAWALGNIAGDGPELRDKVLEAGVIQPLIKLLGMPCANVQFLQNTTWTLSNLCRNKSPATDLKYVEQMLPMLVKLLDHSDRQVKTDACWAMSYLTDGANERIQVVLNHNALPALVKLLATSKEISVLTPVLRSTGNIVTGTDAQTQMVIDSGALKCFKALLTHDKTSIQKEAAWTLSNITAGTSSQIQAFIDEGLVDPLMNCLNHGDFKTQKEAVWCVTNYTSGGTSDQVKLLCQSGAIISLCNMLNCKEDRTIQIILDGIQNILIHAEKLGMLEQAVEAIEECNGLDKIEELQQSANDGIYKIAYKLIDSYFNEDEEGENVDGVIENAVGKDGAFEFTNGADSNNQFNF